MRRDALRFVAAAAAAVLLVAAVIAALGADPLVAFGALYDGSIGSPFNLGQTLMLASLLALTALAAAIPFTARLWNVGAEGQLYIGAVAATAVGLLLPATTPHAVAVIALLCAGALGGALWGAIPGVLKVVANANEVIVTLMLQFIAVLLVQYATTGIWPSGLALQTESLPADALLPTLSSSAGITLGAVLAVVVLVGAWVTMARSALGFQIRATGLNAHAARANGIDVGRVRILAFMLGGAAAGLGGAILVAGFYGQLIADSAAGFGFLGIAVALVARLSPAWIAPTAMLFAALDFGSNTLKVQAGISPAIGQVLVGVFVVALLALGAIRMRYPQAVAE
jgi:simple sugar transport system permease protein